MQNWSEVLTPKTLDIYEPVVTDFYADELFEIFEKHIPKKHGARFQTVWCDGNELIENASSILADNLMDTKRQEYFIHHLKGREDEYIRGAVGFDDYNNVIWIRWGIGCPLDSGCDEILTVEYKF